MRWLGFLTFLVGCGSAAALVVFPATVGGETCAHVWHYLPALGGRADGSQCHAASIHQVELAAAAAVIGLGTWLALNRLADRIAVRRGER